VIVIEKVPQPSVELRSFPCKAQRIMRMSRVVSDLARAESFYRDGLGFRTVTRGQIDAEMLTAFELGDASAQEVVLRLGDES
jgi:hypothetical protein